MTTGTTLRTESRQSLVAVMTATNSGKVRTAAKMKPIENGHPKEVEMAEFYGGSGGT